MNGRRAARRITKSVRRLIRADVASHSNRHPADSAMIGRNILIGVVRRLCDRRRKRQRRAYRSCIATRSDMLVASSALSDRSHPSRVS